MSQTKAQKESAKKRSEASKKAAATRKANQEAENKTEGVEPYRPSHPPLENSGLDQHAAEAQRQEQLTEEREEHNERTGDASLSF